MTIIEFINILQSYTKSPEILKFFAAPKEKMHRSRSMESKMRFNDVNVHLYIEIWSNNKQLKKKSPYMVYCNNIYFRKFRENLLSIIIIVIMTFI